MKDYPFFKAAELQCRCGQCDGGEMDDEFMETILALRRLAGFPFIVSSAYRCPAHNQAVSSTGSDGPHTTGRAIDLAIYGHRAYRLLSLAFTDGDITGLGVSQHGKHSSRFIHLDNLNEQETDGPRPWVWSY